MNDKNKTADKNLDKAKIKKLKERERAKKLKLREREKAKRLKLRAIKKAKLEKARAKKLKERAKKLKLREKAKAKKLRERERAKKLKLREKAKLEREKNKTLKQKAEKVKKPAKEPKEPKVREPRNKAKAEAKRILRESKKSRRACLAAVKSSLLFKGPGIFLDVLNGSPYTGGPVSARFEDGKIKMAFEVSCEIPVSEKFLKSQEQPKGVVPPKPADVSIDAAIEETCPIPPEVAAILANPSPTEDEPLSADIIPAGDLYGSDGRVDEEDLSKMDLDENPEDSAESEDELEDDHPVVPDSRDENDNDLVEARREFYENFSDDLEPLDD